jgi:hypothetical protein
MSYYCAMCKNITDGQPARKNAAGSFCQSCSEKINERAVLAMRGRAAKNECAWCGADTSAMKRGAKKAGGTCNDCEKARERMLLMIRYSDHAAKYVARVEEREKEGRETRAKAAKTAKPEPSKAETVDYERLVRLVVQSLKNMNLTPATK